MQTELPSRLPPAASGEGAMVSHRFLMGRGRDRMTDEEKRVVENAIMEVRTIPARTQIVRRGVTASTSSLLIEGHACRYMDDRDGHRQLVAINVPGDFIDLHAFPMKRLDHDVATIGQAKLAIFDHRTLEAITIEHPRLTRFLWFSTLLDAAMHREWIFRLGRLGAEGRLAHFFCETHARLKMVGLADGPRFSLPLTQTDLAEACGLTGVHVNRTLRTLRQDGVLTFRGGEVTILDSERLDVLAEFQGDYLYVDATQGGDR